MATWYAQNSSVDIDSVNEWNDAANGSGSWLTWGNLGAADILEANAKTAIEINVDSFTCGSIKTLSGGGFTCDLTAGNNRTINADITAGTTPCLVRSGTTKTLTVNGDVTGGSAASAFGISGTDHNAMVINGDVTGGSNASGYGIARGANSHVLTITGDALAATSIAIQIGYHATLTITGNMTATTVSATYGYSSYYTVVLTGNLNYGANGEPPLGGSSRLKWANVASGATMSVRDGSLDAHTVKKPDYPTEAQVESGVDFDYTNLTGTLSGGGAASILGGGQLTGGFA